MREHEERWLSPLAVRSYESRGRNLPEEECRLRTPFQRDRDRIVHSKAFRRLRHKTQVFVDPEGDHFRTRLTHTLETTGIARGVARALRLNEDLVEAIGLGHDLGHPPFGHAGEQALDEVVRERGGRGFRHNEHSLRVVERLERDGRGLNLTWEVRDGILKHTGARRAGDARGQDRAHRRPRRVHQPRHRRRDPRRHPRPGRAAADGARVLGRPARGASTRSCTTSSRRRRRRATSRRATRSAARCSRCARSCSRTCISARTPRDEHAQIRTTIRRIFEHLVDERGDDVEQATDYLAGMTDRFALAYAADLG